MESSGGNLNIPLKDSFGAYLSRVGKIPRLTQEEEVFYFRQYTDAHETILKLISELPYLITVVYPQCCKNKKSESNIDEVNSDAEMESMDMFINKYNNSQVVNNHSSPTHFIDELIFSALKWLKEKKPDGSFINLCKAELEKIHMGLTAPKDPHGSSNNVDKILKKLFLVEPNQFFYLHKKFQKAYINLKEAQNIIVESNLRLIISVVKKQKNIHTSFLDLVQEGSLGLYKAVERFDIHAGFKFSTYATWWIRQAINHYTAENGRTIRIPANMINMISKISHFERKFVQLHGREPNATEISKDTSISPSKVRALKKMANQTVSLQKIVGASTGPNLQELIADSQAENPSAKAEFISLKEVIQSALNTLTERERDIIVQRFGLEGGEQASFIVLSEKYGVSRERIRQIEEAALAKLKQNSSGDYFDG